MWSKLLKNEFILYRSFRGFKIDVGFSILVCMLVLFLPLSSLVAFYPNIGNLYLPIIGGFAALKSVFIIFDDKVNQKFVKIASNGRAQFNYFAMKFASNSFYLIGSMFIPIFILMVRLAFYNGVDYDTVVIINGFHNLSFYIVTSSLFYSAIATALALIIVMKLDKLSLCIMAAVGVIFFYALVDNLYYLIWSDRTVWWWLYFIPGATFSSSISSIRISLGSWIDTVTYTATNGLTRHSAIPVWSLLSTMVTTVALWWYVWNSFMNYKHEARRKSKKY